MAEEIELEWSNEHLAYEWTQSEWDPDTGFYTLTTTAADGSQIVLRLDEERGMQVYLFASYNLIS